MVLKTLPSIFIIVVLTKSVQQLAIIPGQNVDFDRLFADIHTKGKPIKFIKLLREGIEYDRYMNYNYRRNKDYESDPDSSENEEEILHKLLKPDRGDKGFSKWLRQKLITDGEITTAKDEGTYLSSTGVPILGLHKSEHAAVLDNEIKTVLSQNSSALNMKPYIETHGLNDFLVMQPGANDMFVTVIPNDIYYNIEKKCVNWLDNCNLMGLRQQLLTKIRSP